MVINPEQAVTEYSIRVEALVLWAEHFQGCI